MMQSVLKYGFAINKALGSGGGVAFEGKYEEIRQLVLDNKLVPGSYYILTDYQCYSLSCDYRHTPERLLLLAISEKEFYKTVQSLDHQDEIMLFDFNDSDVVAESYGEYDDGDEQTKEVIIQLQGDSSFTTSKKLVVSDDFELELEANGIYYVYDADSIKDDLIGVEDDPNGDGSLITLKDKNIDFSISDYNYIYIEGLFNFEKTNGRVLQRTNLTKNIKRNFDWRGKKVRKWLFYAQSYIAGNSYTANKIIEHNDKLYMCVLPFNITSTNSEPGVSIYWVDLGVTHSSLFSNNYNNNQNYIDTFTIADYDFYKNESTLNIENVINLDTTGVAGEEDNTVFLNMNSISDVVESSGRSYYINSLLQDVIVKSGSSVINNSQCINVQIDQNNTIISNEILSSQIGAQNGIYVKNILTSKIGTANHIVAGEISKSIIGNKNSKFNTFDAGLIANTIIGNSNIGITALTYDQVVIGDSNLYLANESNNINNTQIGNHNEYIQFFGEIRNSKIGNYNVGLSSSFSRLIITESVLGNNSYKFNLWIRDYSNVKRIWGTNKKYLIIDSSQLAGEIMITSINYPPNGSNILKNIISQSSLNGIINLTDYDKEIITKTWLVRSDEKIIEIIYDSSNNKVVTQIS